MPLRRPSDDKQNQVGHLRRGVYERLVEELQFSFSRFDLPQDIEQINRITSYPVGDDRYDRVAGLKASQKPGQLRPLRIPATELLVEYPIASGCLQPFGLTPCGGPVSVLMHDGLLSHHLRR